jgi:hypothetical protein
MPAPAAYRWSMIFQYVSGSAIGGGNLNLKGGWSESVYSRTAGSANQANILALAQARALLLPASAYISGIRVQGVDPSGGANTQAANIPGLGTYSSNPQDIPQMAVLLRVQSSSTTNIRSMRLAAIPDAQVTAGEFKPSNAFMISLNVFFTQLSGWLMRVQDLNQTLYPIATIDAAGNVVLSSPWAVLPNTAVKIKRTIDSFGNQKGLKTTIVTVTDPTHFRVQPWPFGSCTLGQIQPFVIIYPGIVANQSSISRAVVRKIGRPSLAYRGRRSKRRP